jgi:integrase
MRKGEILSLTWANIHLTEQYAHLGSTKNGDQRNVPLSSAAIRLLKLARCKPKDRVVPITSGYLDVLFREARIACKLRHVRFHDSRREAATVMSKKLSNVLELSAVTGHKSLQTLKAYYAPDPSYLADKLG